MPPMAAVGSMTTGCTSVRASSSQAAVKPAGPAPAITATRFTGGSPPHGAPGVSIDKHHGGAAYACLGNQRKKATWVLKASGSEVVVSE